MTKTATKPQNLAVYMVLENTTSGLTGLTALGPLYNDAVEGTLVQIIRLTRFDWGKFEQEFEEIPILDRPQVLRHPTREDATLTFEVPATDDDTDAELSASHFLWAARYFAMGVSKAAAGAAEYNFIDDTASDKAADLLGFAIEAVQYADDAHTVVQFRRRIHNCFLSVKPSYNAAGKLTKVEVTISDARYIDQDDSDVAATHSDA